MPTKIPAFGPRRIVSVADGWEGDKVYGSYFVDAVDTAIGIGIALVFLDKLNKHSLTRNLVHRLERLGYIVTLVQKAA